MISAQFFVYTLSHKLHYGRCEYMAHCASIVTLKLERYRNITIRKIESNMTYYRIMLKHRTAFVSLLMKAFGSFEFLSNSTEKRTVLSMEPKRSLKFFKVFESINRIRYEVLASHGKEGVVFNLMIICTVKAQNKTHDSFPAKVDLSKFYLLCSLRSC